MEPAHLFYEIHKNVTSVVGETVNHISQLLNTIVPSQEVWPAQNRHIGIRSRYLGGDLGTFFDCVCGDQKRYFEPNNVVFLSITKLNVYVVLQELTQQLKGELCSFREAIKQ